ncbi:hypothetical protein EHS25_007509 [Saitozyma podzolica]|uniref:Uncharacterized protein n=1 Tax=Saitozyma podzolica TaxID=1890683 RepID=A0A427YQ37_9TREE|nr:hypothetical protein EHS25_007509 [Saitozyma podzolica]
MVPVPAIVPSQSEPRRVPATATVEDRRQPSWSWPLDHHNANSSWSYPIPSLPFDPTPIHPVSLTIEGTPSWSVDPRDTPEYVDSLHELTPTPLASAPNYTPKVVPHPSLSAIHTAFEATHQWANPNQAFPTLLSTEPIPSISYPCSPLLPPLLPTLLDPSPLTLPSPAPPPGSVPVPESIMDWPASSASCPPRGIGPAGSGRTTDTDADRNIMGGIPGIGINPPLAPVISLPSGILRSDIVRPTATQDAAVSLIVGPISAPFVIDRKDMDHEVYHEASVAVSQDMPHTSEGYFLARQITDPPPIPPRTNTAPSQAPFTTEATVATSNPTRYLDLNTVFSFHPPPFDAIAIPISNHANDPYPYPYPYPYPHSSPLPHRLPDPKCRPNPHTKPPPNPSPVVPRVQNEVLSPSSALLGSTAPSPSLRHSAPTKVKLMLILKL